MQFIISLLVVVIPVLLVSAHSPMEVFATSEREHVEEDWLGDFGSMVKCATGRFKLRYNGYGCYCGIGGKGTPVDAVDTCCQVHDNCYKEIKAAGGPCAKRTKLTLLGYRYSCASPFNRRNRSKELEITCRNLKKPCKKALCECDKAAALCFAKNEYNGAYRKYNRKANCKA